MELRPWPPGIWRAILGDLLGVILGVQSNVGGVGFAMLLLILSTDWMRRTGRLPQLSEQGILFWSAMYIPIVVAMAAQQNVVAALAGGPIANRGRRRDDRLRVAGARGGADRRAGCAAAAPDGAGG